MRKCYSIGRVPSEQYSRVIEKLTSFVNSSEPGILLLKGKWGVGKTTLWKRFIAKANPKRHVAYVSVFGIKDLETLKETLAFAVNHPEAPAAKKLKDIFKIIPSKYGNYTYSANTLAAQLVKNAVICVDDIERRQKTLELREILGYLDVLRNEQNTSSVVIMDEDSLDGESAKEMKTFREKVFDKELEYRPEITENLNIVFGDNCEKAVREIFLRAQCNNIRIMKKTDSVIEEFGNVLSTLQENARNRVLTQISSLSLFRYHFTKEITLQDLYDKKYLDRFLRDTQEPETEAEQVYQKLQFEGTGIDKHILDYLEQGQTDLEAAKVAAQEVNAAYIADNFQTEKLSFFSTLFETYLWDDFTAAQRINEFLDAYRERLASVDIYRLLVALKFCDDTFDFETRVSKELSPKISKLNRDMRSHLKLEINDKHVHALIDSIPLENPAGDRASALERLKTELEKGALDNNNIGLLRYLTEDDLIEFIRNESDPIKLRALQNSVPHLVAMNSEIGETLAGTLNGALAKLGQAGSFTQEKLKSWHRDIDTAIDQIHHFRDIAKAKMQRYGLDDE